MNRVGRVGIASLLLISMVLAISLAGCASASPQPASVVTVAAGEQAPVPATDLTISVVQTQNLTGQGCLGGPIGCRDSAELLVSRGSEIQRVVLYLPRTAAEAEQGVNQARLFGYAIQLIALRGTRVTLRVEATGG